MSLSLLAPAVAGAAAFDFPDVLTRAQELARADFEAPSAQVPKWLLEINYDQWRDIRFRPEKALWRDRSVPFNVQFFHPGLYYDRTIRVNVVESDGVKPLPFSPSSFDYGKNDFASRVPQDLGYAGFRVHFPIKTPQYKDEVIVFLGASYFRAVGKGEVFGLSARGLAIDTGASRGEEFPYFREYWLVSPSPKAKELVVYALLDSPSVTGAYRFTIAPGEETTVRVDATLYFRRNVGKLGIAPLTSMFFFGENTVQPFDDFRPEVHDSDGLLVNFNSGEWVWRPLDNPETLSISGFDTTGPRGFGLLQRDRTFDHYQDLEARYDRRPSTWVTTNGDWGPGRVELVEIPTNDYVNDNVVASWVPRDLPKSGDSRFYSYTVSWFGDDPARAAPGSAVATRRDRRTGEDVHRFVVDFEGKRLSSIPEDKILRGVVAVMGGEQLAEVLDQQVVKNPVTGGWRLTFRVRPKRNDPVELRAFLDKDGETLTETWSYAILP